MTDMFRYYILPDKIYVVEINGTKVELLGSAILDYIKEDYESSGKTRDQA
jgi:hypothetical protein